MHYEGKRISWLKTVGGVEKTLRFLIIIKKQVSVKLHAEKNGRPLQRQK